MTTIIKCGSCSGLELERLKLSEGQTTFCSTVGVLPTASKCKSYKPNASILKDANERESDPLHLLASSISHFTESELAVLGALLINERRTRKRGYRFWQKVYCRVSGTASDLHLSCFLPGRILDATDSYVRVMSETGKTCIQFFGSDSDGSTILTVSQFKALKPHLDQKVFEPKRRRSTNEMDFEFEQRHLVSNDRYSVKKASPGGQLDLVTLVARVAQGRILSRKEKHGYYGDSNEPDTELKINHF
jgi:hypothetical protein